MPSMFFFDFETSGLDPKRHGILQAAWIIEQPDKLLVEKCFDVQPGCECDFSLAALDINGFTLDRIKVAHAGEYVMRIMEADLKVAGYFERCIPIGHRVDFDLSFLREADNRYRTHCGQYLDYTKQIDTCAVARWLDHCESGFFINKKPVNYKLETLCGIFDIPIKSHDALEDARAVRKLYHILKKAVEL